MRKALEITGQKFGRLTAIKFVKKNKKGLHIWLFKCDCGKEKMIIKQYVLSGQVKSCGCLLAEKRIESHTVHGFYGTSIYKTWQGIKRRCYYTNFKDYKNYGARGVLVCDEWKNDFINFYNWAITNGYKEGLTIDRIDVNGDYEPNNCRWVTTKIQNRNKRNCIFITYKNNTYCLGEWAERLNINYNTLNARIKKYKWNIEKAFETPVY